VAELAPFKRPAAMQTLGRSRAHSESRRHPRLCADGMSA
jgi:hypothetical protein